MNKSINLFLLIILLFKVSAFAQTTNTNNQLSKIQTWQLLDYQQDTVYGMGVNKAYDELLKGKKSHPVIVAVIDDGIDTNHEDLKGHIWTNTKEIPNNGIDDDKNGYVDDIHGWNFLGGKDGRIMYAISTEADREYYRLFFKYASIQDSSQATDKKEYAYFIRAKQQHIEDSIARAVPQLIFIHQLKDAIYKFAVLTGKQKIYVDNVNSFQPADSLEDTIKKTILKFYESTPPQVKTWDIDSFVNSEDAKNSEAYLEEIKSLNSELKPDPNELRKEIVGDDPFNINDRNYGNNNIDDAKHYGGHGTNCAGIIAAIRNNGICMNGITGNVLIMPVRISNTVAPGDEMDKDVALAIRYAVDNGAKVINMSFGKYFSPQKKFVDDAIKYAATKGVLLVHGVGNDHSNIDSFPFYPSHEFLNSERAENFINVGAISEDTGYAVSTDFSNYGQKEVDLFAPGVDIYFPAPNNKCQSWFGTSYATPMVAGVAALLLEYYPTLTAIQEKNIILQSVTSLKGKIVYKPGTQEKVDFATLCLSGGVVNAYNALQLADKMSSKK